VEQASDKAPATRCAVGAPRICIFDGPNAPVLPSAIPVDHENALRDVVVFELRDLARDCLLSQATSGRERDVVLRRLPVFGQARFSTFWLFRVALGRSGPVVIIRGDHSLVSVIGFNILGIQKCSFLRVFMCGILRNWVCGFPHTFRLMGCGFLHAMLLQTIKGEAVNRRPASTSACEPTVFAELGDSGRNNPTLPTDASCKVSEGRAALAGSAVQTVEKDAGDHLRGG
jgi:hypothetical protein